MREVFVLHNSHAELQALGLWCEEITGGCGERDRFRIDLVLAEVVTNIIDNAFPDGGTHEIRVRALRHAGGMEFEVFDPGHPFDPTRAEPRPVAASLHEATPGGHGLRLMRSYTDSLAYTREPAGNRLTLGFRLAGG